MAHTSGQEKRKKTEKIQEHHFQSARFFKKVTFRSRLFVSFSRYSRTVQNSSTILPKVLQF